MKVIISKHEFMFLVGFIVTFNVTGQIQLSTFMDAGKNNVSDGAYVQTSVWGRYKIRKTGLQVGSQYDLRSPCKNVFTGITANVTQQLSIREVPFEIGGFFLYNLFSEVVHESNWGVLAAIERNHFTVKLGTDFRTYSITPAASKDYNIETDKKIHEYCNLIYLIGYNLKPLDSRWNVGISVTDIDLFLINQSTNPMFYLNGKYDVISKLTLILESWYKSAGMFNISANYFGFFIRTGLIWKIDLEK